MAHPSDPVGRDVPLAGRDPHGHLAPDAVDARRHETVRERATKRGVHLATTAIADRTVDDELSFHVETWASDDDRVSDEERGDRLADLYDELESRGARGTVVSFGGVPGGPGASFAVEGAIEPSRVGEAVEVACSLFLEACEAAGLEHRGIAYVELQTMERLGLALDHPAETYVGAAELAGLFGVSRQRIQELRRRPGFPAPVAELAAGPVWRVSTLHRFLATWERRPGRPSSETGG